MAFLVRKEGESDWAPWLACDLCGRPFLLDEAWIGTAPLDPAVTARTGVIGCRSCLDGACQQIFGAPRCTQWRGEDYFRRLLAPTGLESRRMQALLGQRGWHR